MSASRRRLTSTISTLPALFNDSSPTYLRLLAQLLALGQGALVHLPESHDPRIVEASHIVDSLGVNCLLSKGDDQPGQGSFLSVPAVDLDSSAKLLMDGTVDASVVGVSISSRDVLAASLRGVGRRTEDTLISSLMLMVVNDRVLGFGDCVVNPTPDSDQLATIAVDCAAAFRYLTGVEPQIAMLSFSSWGSAPHPQSDKVREATSRVRERCPKLQVEGELQVDAALVAEVAQSKTPDSQVPGTANLLIFPSLEAGNIGYKLTERLAGAQVVGPAILGLSKPFLDISRGSGVREIVAQCLLAAALSCVPATHMVPA